MIKYKVFFENVGSLYDAYRNHVIPIELSEDSPEAVSRTLEYWLSQGELRTDLEFVILPVFVPLTK